MPELNELIKTRDRLRPTTTRLTNEDGCVREERRVEDGSFAVIFENEDSQRSEIAKNGFKPSKRMLKSWGIVLDFAPDLQIAKIAEGVYLSGQDVAQDLELVLRNGITHIVNAATGVRSLFPDKIKYLELTVLDLPTENLKRHFSKVNDFIWKVVEKKGRVLVHCNAGVSRSSTLVLAYLMRHEGLTLDAALAQVRQHRPVARPNNGFMEQLREYEKELSLSKI